jgi:acyl-CoA synthetase (AMP-forming)/AMP-acid ligase II
MSPTTMLEAVEAACQRWPERTALIHGDRSMSYGELWESMLKQAGRFAELGIGAGDRVLCTLPNGFEHVAALGASWMQGAVHAAADHQLTDAEVHRLAGIAGAALVLRRRQDGGLEAEVRQDCRHGAAPRPPEPKDNAYVLLSSGTTGVPKAIVVDHGPFSSSLFALADRLGLGPDDTHLGQLPLAFGFGMQVAMVSLVTGGRLVLMERFSTREAVRLIRTHRVTVLDGTPAHYLLVLNAAENADDLRSLRAGIGSGDIFTPALLTRILRQGMRFLLMYGTAEGFGVSTSDPKLLRRGSVGIPSPGTLAVLDPEGHELKRGELGAIAWRRAGGPSNRTLHEVDPGKWFHTGDLGWLDHDGCLYVVGRLKHQINRGGLKIDPAEVATAVQRLAGVAAAAVIPVPDDVLGELVCVCVVAAPGASEPTLDAIRTALEGELAPYKLPEQLCVVDSIPTTANGKLDVKALQFQVMASERREVVERRREGRRQPAGADGDSVAALEAAWPRLVQSLAETRAGLDAGSARLLDLIVTAASNYVRWDRDRGPRVRRQRYLKPLLAGPTRTTADLMQALPQLVGVDGPVASTLSPNGGPGLDGCRERADATGRLLYRLFLGCAVRGLAPHGHLPAGQAGEAARVALACLGRVQAIDPLYMGRPQFLGEDVLGQLRDEAAAARSSAVLERGFRLGRIGPVGRAMAFAPELQDLLAGGPDRLEPTGSGKYVYIDSDAPAIGTHLHVEPFAVNVELKLLHENGDGPLAPLELHPPGSGPLEVALEPGGLIAWYAGGVPHARRPVATGERIVALSVWYEPVEWTRR